MEKQESLFKYISESQFDKYKESIYELTESQDTYDILDRLDDMLIKYSKKAPEKVIKACEINLKVYENRYIKMYGYTFNTILAAYTQLRDSSNILEIFKQSIEYVIDNNLVLVGESIVKNIWLAVERKCFNKDEYLELLNVEVSFFRHFKKFDECIDRMLKAANIFLSVGAFQSAYRILSEAKAVALENKLINRQTEILENVALVAFFENDFNYAEIYFKKAIELFKFLKKDIPKTLLFNLATAKMNINKNSEAMRLFRYLYKSNMISMGLNLKCLLNMAICERKSGNLKEAVIYINNVLESFQEIESLEEKIELCLTAAKIFQLSNQHIKSIQYTKKAVYIIEEQLNEYSRLHYRRGIRENYIKRFRDIIVNFPSNGDIDTILEVIIFTKLNIYSDWFSFLNWYERVLERMDLPEVIKDEITENLQKLMNFGAPVLYGFREKYDDPFETPLNTHSFLKEAAYHIPWQNLNLTIKKVLKHTKMNTPYQDSKVDVLAEIVRKKLSDKSYLLFFYTTKDYIYIIRLFEQKYIMYKFSSKIVLDFTDKLEDYRNKKLGFDKFVRQLNKFTKFLDDNLKEIFKDILDCKPKKIIILNNQFTISIPIIGCLISNDDTRDFLKKEVEILCCPVLFPSLNKEILYNNFVGIVQDNSDLQLAESEIKNIMNILKPSNPDILYIDNTDPDDYKRTLKKSDDFIRTLKNAQKKSEDLIQTIKKADIIHFSTHGTPIGNFTDPSFASIPGTMSDNNLSFDMIQSHIWTFKYNSVFLNICDSHDIANHNLFKFFDTNEMISYSSTFLLNRKSSIISTLWSVKDILSFFYSYLYYKNLALGLKPSYAYLKATIGLYELNKNECLNILDSIENEILRNKKKNIMKNCPAHPFRNIYSYGAYTISGLL